MKGSVLIVSDLLSEVDTLTFRFRNVKQCLNRTTNLRLRERIIDETQNIFDRINEIKKIAELFNKGINNNINLSTLLTEKCKRTLIETKTEINLFSF
tara:strand:+ start:2022 stop:2312 length:291 start_codon:yes stop_codon:yes gene_type:complete